MNKLEINNMLFEDIKNIDENGFEYNLHLKCEYVSPLGNAAVVYPLRQEVRIIKAEF
jgi:hypothetical protein